jgi:hypothetical protein
MSDSREKPSDRTQAPYDLKLSKINYGLEFLDKLHLDTVVFAGISGSVSYMPKENDDVDIFLITEDDALWSVIARAFLLRRSLKMHDICISLCMSRSYALHYFSNIEEDLIISDANHVIPVHGHDFYRYLLSIMGKKGNILYERSQKSRVSLRRTVLFSAMSSFLLLKGYFVNIALKRDGKSAEAFRTLAAKDYFILDSEKYRLLKMKASGDSL